MVEGEEDAIWVWLGFVWEWILWYTALGGLADIYSGSSAVYGSTARDVLAPTASNSKRRLLEHDDALWQKDLDHCDRRE